MDVALGPHGPKDGPDVFGVSLVIGWCLPGEGLQREGVLTPHAKLLEDLNDGNLSVQGIEMDTMHLEKVKP